ncbi:YcaO-like family protein [Streptomyces sp. BE308]|uniref:YcaO-like family protein n=1 Tax=Streptomyces sp. BE308 TaxID=3002529 RepID=UPI002E775C11|nr:YcaO-like family protein [Streptomyces sp. BE308]MEE1795531.1 YcaO-like family protein [Streptomyces sp. BE308]
MSVSPWEPQVFTPYAAWPEVVFARVAARSPQFDPVCAAGNRPIVVGSAAGHRPPHVVASARGELLERVSNILAGRAAESDAGIVATHGELRRKGIPALDPAELMPGVPDDSRHARRLWVRGRSLRTGADLHVPAGAVFLHHRPPAGCDPGPGAGSTGLAAHPDPEAAVQHAAWEVLERDLIRRSWYGLSRAPRAVPAAELPEPLAKLLDGMGVRATVLDLPAPVGSRCVAVCLHAPDGTRQAFGARCGPDGQGIAPLIEKAAYEALMVRWSVHTPVADDTWTRWQGRDAPDSAVEHALWAYHRQDSLRLWTERAPVAPRETPPPSAGPDPVGPGPRTGPDRSGTVSHTVADPSGNGSHTVADLSGTAVLSGHTGQDLILVDTTCEPARGLGSAVVRVVAPGAHALPTGPDDERHLPAAPGPHPFG